MSAKFMLVNRCWKQVVFNKLEYIITTDRIFKYNVTINAKMHGNDIRACEKDHFRRILYKRYMFGLRLLDLSLVSSQIPSALQISHSTKAFYCGSNIYQLIKKSFATSHDSYLFITST